ncbi:hypothetical protein [Nocardia sp. CA-119907]|uniref:hypothetical protein n=1 Tax=Nocardia sp. CA-119907 TaxID=3239973 RepID=UPI003D984945
MSTWQQVVNTVTSGQCVAGVVAEFAGYYPWPGLAFVPIRDAAPSRWALVWRAAESPLIRAFAETVSDVVGDN